MLYIGYWIILDGKNIYKKSVSEISIFELPRLKNCISRLCPGPLGSPPPPPRMVTCELSPVWCWLRRSKHNREHMHMPPPNTQIG